MEWDYIHSSTQSSTTQASTGTVSLFNLKTFDIVFNPGFGMASITILKSVNKIRIEKIKKIFKQI